MLPYNISNTNMRKLRELNLKQLQLFFNIQNNQIKKLKNLVKKYLL